MQIAAASAIRTTPESLTAGFNAGPRMNSQMPFAAGPNTSVFGNVLFSCLGQANSDESSPSGADPQTEKNPFERVISARFSHAGPELKNEIQKRSQKGEAQNSAPAGGEAAEMLATTPASADGAHSSQQAQSAPQTSQASEHPQSGNPPVMASSNLAFAMRIDQKVDNSGPPPGDPSDATIAVAESGSTSKSPHAPVVVGEISNGSQERQTSTSDKDGQGFAGEEQPPIPTRTSSPVEQQSASRAKPDFEAELSHATGAVRGAHVQVVGDGNQRVDIQLVERGGSLAVSVRSSDSTLTHDLQEHIPELASRLQSDHYHSQTWTPSSGNPAGARDGGGSTSGHGYPSGSGGGQQQKRHDGDKPRWVEELEKNEGKSNSKETFYVSSNQF